MKKIAVVFFLCVCVGAVLPAQARKGGTMYVAVKNLELKSGTGFFSAARGKLEYGAAVTVLQINGKWAEVSSTAGSSVSGWTSVVNLSAKRIIHTGGSSGASASEVALAGKGFNQEIENSNKATGKVNYDDVDRTEAQKVTNKELYDFIIEGSLFQGDKK